MSNGEEQTKYNLTASLIKDENGTAVTVYGISARRGERSCRVDDISENAELVKELIQRLSSFDAPPDILPEAAEDFIVEKYSSTR